MREETSKSQIDLSLLQEQVTFFRDGFMLGVSRHSEELGWGKKTLD